VFRGMLHLGLVKLTNGNIFLIDISIAQTCPALPSVTEGCAHNTGLCSSGRASIRATERDRERSYKCMRERLTVQTAPMEPNMGRRQGRSTVDSVGTVVRGREKN